MRDIPDHDYTDKTEYDRRLPLASSPSVAKGEPSEAEALWNFVKVQLPKPEASAASQHYLDDPEWVIDYDDEPMRLSCLLWVIALGIIILVAQHYFNRWTEAPRVHIGTVTLIDKRGNYIGDVYCKSAYAVNDSLGNTWTTYTQVPDGGLIVTCSSGLAGGGDR